MLEVKEYEQFFKEYEQMFLKEKDKLQIGLLQDLNLGTKFKHHTL